MTPLNSILNLTDMLMIKNQRMMQNLSQGKVQYEEDEIMADHESLKIINSSTQMMKIMNQSLLDS